MSVAILPEPGAKLGGEVGRLVKARVKVVFAYPEPADKLTEHGGEFLPAKGFRAFCVILLDLDYEFTNRYGLRWNSRRETVHRFTFVIHPQGTVLFSRLARSHRARTTAADVLEVLLKRPL